MSTYYVAGLPYSDELYHFGIKGQKWGIRRFQNPDGTLTPAGKARYGTIDNLKEGRREDQASYRYNKAGESGWTGLKRKIKDVASIKKKEISEKQAYRNKLIKDAANVHKMSDKEILEKIGRLQREKQLMDLTYERLTTAANPEINMVMQAGKRVVSNAISGGMAYGFKSTIPDSDKYRELASYMFPNPNKKK